MLAFRKNKLEEVAFECKYCQLLANEEADQHLWNKKLFETENFVVIPTVGAIVEGWLLVVPKKHFINIGAVPVTQHDELRHIVNIAKQAVSETYTDPLIFEHGPNGCGTTVGCGIDHAHLHVVPIRLDFALTDVSSDFRRLHPPAGVDAYQYQNLLYQRKIPYLYLQEPCTEPIFLTSGNIPSQYFRRLIAEKQQLPDFYDYNKYDFMQNVKKTVYSLQNTFTV